MISLSAATTAVSAVLGKTPTPVSVAKGQSIYWFRAMDGSKTAFEVRLRLAPNALRYVQPVRAQVSMDFNGGVTVLDGGLGIGRWNLSGQHGVGKLDDATLAKNGGDSEGLAAMKALHGFFARWADENAKRSASGKPGLVMVFALVGGGPTELRYGRWKIWPDAFPTQERGNHRPLDWDWSASFQVIEALDKIEPQKPAAPNVLGRSSALGGLLDKLGVKPWDPNKNLLQNLQEMKRNADRIRTGVQGAIKDVTKSVRGLTGAARGIAEVGTAILRDTRNGMHDLRAGAVGDVRGVRDAAIASRRLAGSIAREARGGRS